jgi:hypothetical protein
MIFQITIGVRRLSQEHLISATRKSLLFSMKTEFLSKPSSGLSAPNTGFPDNDAKDI